MHRMHVLPHQIEHANGNAWRKHGEAGMATNSAPKCKWWKTDFGHTVRQRLYVDGRETPYFVDSSHVTGHKTEGQPHGLFGSGMSKGGFAATLASGRSIAVLKHRAEQMATA